MASTTQVGLALEGSHLPRNGEESGLSGETVLTKLDYYVRDPKHEYEKPYEIRYDTGGLIPDTNIMEEPKPVVIQNFRMLQSYQSLQDYGFTSAKVHCSLKAAEFDDESKVKNEYYPAVEQALRKAYPDADEVKILEHILRKRDARYPHNDTYETMQPSAIAHVDYTLESARRTCQAAFQKTPSQYKRLLTVNVWKSLQGPGNDWPLALCDWRTLKRGSDSIALDVVYHNRYTESEGLYYNSEQQWFYFKDLEPHEIIIFQQTDSACKSGGGVAHASFFNPNADKSAAPRSSIELRAFVFHH